MARVQPTPIPNGPAAPQRGDRNTFKQRVDDFIAWLINVVALFNALATNVYNNALDAYGSASAAQDSSLSAANAAATAEAHKQAAAGSATNAAASADSAAASAAAAAGTQVTTFSTTEMAVGVGVKVFQVEAAKQFKPNVPVLVVSGANKDAWMYGTVKTYVGTVLSVDVTAIGPALITRTDWNITVSGVAGPAGTSASNTQFNVGPLPAGEINCGLGYNYFKKTVAGTVAFTFSNVPQGFSFTLEMQYDSGAAGWPSSVLPPGGNMPTLQTGKTHVFVFVTSNGGVTWRIGVLPNYANG